MIEGRPSRRLVLCWLRRRRRSPGPRLSVEIAAVAAMASSRDHVAATPSTCVVPRRFSYYFAGGHERHHLHVGTPRDADADALFWLWERQPVHEADIYGIKKPKPSPKWPVA